MHIPAQNGVSAAIAERPQLLFEDGCRHGRIFFRPFGDGRFERIEVAVALPLGGCLRRRIEIPF